jgi:molybdate transport system substrate-binding protein
MKKTALATAAAFAAGLVLVAPALADDLKILTGAGMTGAIRELAAGFQKNTGTRVAIVSDTTGGVQKRLEGGEKADLVLATSPVMETLARAGLVSAERTDIARVQAGLAVKKGAREPEISTVEAVKRTLLAANSIAYVDPSLGGIAGPYFVGLAQKMGILQQVRDKAVLRKTGAEVAAAVAAGEAETGISLVSELLPNPGVTVAGALPAEVQMDTIYTAALGASPANAAAAGKFLTELRGSEGQLAIRESGLLAVAQ